eukprot:Phypoly_transcript_03325.p1 GENE.Phypoly_transcript_03325~~Phypoly_transcript_03325.p1  ORF type:complete len:808 (+),score=72.12 Phypoly_transcript_03325:115-2424(+)
MKLLVAGFLSFCLAILFFPLCHSVQVTPFANCTNCTVIQYLFPSLTEYVFLMQDGAVYRSVDEGQTWNKIANNITHMYQYWSDPSSLVLRNFESTSFSVTQDGGATFTANTFPVLPLSPYVYDGLILHPTEPGWMAIFPNHSNTWGNYTKDYGVNWLPFASPIHFHGDASWCHRPNSSDIFFAIVENNGTFNFSYTMNYGAEWNHLRYNAHNFTQTRHFLFVTAHQENSTEIELWASSVFDDSNHTDRFRYKLCMFNGGTELNRTVGYQILADVDNGELIAIQHNSTSEWGSLFSSEFSGAFYGFSLPHLALINNSTFDFQFVASLQGVFIANQLHPNNQSRTVFSSDSGGSWYPLIAPERDINGDPFNCNYTMNCTLNLHATSVKIGYEVFPGLFGIPSAIGIVLATGNTGSYLEFNGHNTSTFISRDGGLFWHQLWNETMVYGIGNHGGIIVFGHPYHRNESFVHYTLDHGATQKIFQITNPSNLSMAVTNIIPTPFGTTTKFVLLASDDTGNGYIYQLDFSDELNVTCNTDKDYEYWSPTDFVHQNETCFLGATSVFLRRKYNVSCFDNITDHFVSSTPCPCTFVDYECEFGFYPTSRRNETYGFTCAPFNASDIPSCLTGYRLVPGTMCNVSNGLDLVPRCFNITTTSTTQTGTTGGVTTGPVTTSTIFQPLASSTISTATGSSTSTGPPSTSSTTREPVTTTGGPAKKSKNHAGLAVGLTFLFLFLGAVTVLGAMYWRHDGFRGWVDNKIGRGDSAAVPILGKR